MMKRSQSGNQVISETVTPLGKASTTSVCLILSVRPTKESGQYHVVRDENCSFSFAFTDYETTQTGVLDALETLSKL